MIILFLIRLNTLPLPKPFPQLCIYDWNELAAADNTVDDSGCLDKVRSPTEPFATGSALLFRRKAARGGGKTAALIFVSRPMAHVMRTLNLRLQE